MSSTEPEFDVVIFGATGFTGKVVSKTMAACGKKWAIAGRNLGKLQAVVDELLMDGAVKNKDEVSIIQADVGDASSMDRMCCRTRVLLNCTGPFRYFGEPVVSACIKNGCHYLDITGEPEFIENMMLKYHDRALRNDVLVVSSCGFDSIPADMGVAFTQGQFPEGGCASSIENFITLHSGPAGYSAHATTWECAVEGFGNAQELKRIRRQRGRVEVPVTGPRLRRLGALQYDGREGVGGRCIPFVGSDASVVRQSQAYLVTEGEKSATPPCQFATYVPLRSYCGIAKLLLAGGIFALLTKWGWSRRLLIKYPRLFSFGAFSHEGPSERQRAEASFEMLFIGHGYQHTPPPTPSPAAAAAPPLDWKVVTKISGPEPGYASCAIAIVQSALTVLEEGDRLPRGVITPASAFRASSLVQRLDDNGLTFSVVSQGPMGGGSGGSMGGGGGEKPIICSERRWFRGGGGGGAAGDLYYTSNHSQIPIID